MEGGVAREHAQIARPRQLGQDVLGQAIAEILLVCVTAEVDEGKDGDPRTFGCTGRLDCSLGRRRPMLAQEPCARREERQDRRGDRHRSLPPHALIRGGAFWRRSRLRTHAVDAHRLGDVLNLLLAQEIEPEVELAFDRVVDGGGDTDASGLCERLHARSDVDAVSIDRPVSLLDHIAEVDADAELHPPLCFELNVVAFERLLNFNRGLYGFDRARELGKECVARRVDDAPTSARNEARDHVATGFERADGRRLVGRHQAGIADHICAEDCCQLTSAA